MKKWILVAECVLVFALVFLCTFFNNAEMRGNDIAFNIRQCLLVAFVAFLVFLTLKRRVFTRDILPFALVFMSYAFIIPLIHFILSSEQSTSFHLARWSAIEGAYITLFLISLETLLQKRCANFWGKMLFICSYLLAFFVPLIEIGYSLIYGKAIGESAIFAIYGTNFSEAFEYILTFVGLGTVFSVMLLLLVFSYGIYKTRRWQTLSTISSTWKVYSLTLLLLFYLAFDGIVHVPLMNTYTEVHTYLKEQAKFSKNYAEKLQNLKLTSKTTLVDKAQGTIILVIGESASRNLMQSYQKDYPFNNTPYLSSLRTKEDFLVFDNIYSCYPQTVPALMRALTDKSQYNDHAFYDSMTVLDVAKKAGYKTYWFTNQGLYDKYSSLVTMMAERADVLRSTGEIHKKYDGDLLPFLKEVKKTENNFIVFHLMGSHARYSNRYPKEEMAFGEDTREKTYANTILYTDNFLKNVISYAKENLNLQMLIYFSDHGENLETGHNPQLKQYDTVRIPCFIYLSPLYQKIYPEKTALLKKRREEFFSNDMFYNTFLGMIDAKSNRYDEKEDLSSANYAFSKDNVKVFLGELLAKDDPFLEK